MLFFSCSKNDDPVTTPTPKNVQVAVVQDPNPTNTVVGKYLLTEFNTEFETDLNGDNIGSKNQKNETSCYDNYSLELKADGTYTHNSRIVVKNSSTNMAMCNEATNLFGTYTVSGNEVTLVPASINYAPKKYTFSGSKILKSEKVRLTVLNYFGGQFLPASSEVEYVYSK